MKKCSKCGLPKEQEEFYKQSKGHNGRSAECKKCWLKRLKKKKEENDLYKMIG